MQIPKVRRTEVPEKGHWWGERAGKGITAGDPMNLTGYQCPHGGISPLIHSELSKRTPAQALKCSSRSATLTKVQEAPTAGLSDPSSHLRTLAAMPGAEMTGSNQPVLELHGHEPQGLFPLPARSPRNNGGGGRERAGPALPHLYFLRLARLYPIGAG